jgi:hypothetical protein
MVGLGLIMKYSNALKNVQNALIKRNKQMKKKLSIIISIIQCAFGGAILGFLVGDLLIGVNIWLFNSIKTGHWDSSDIRLRYHYGIIFAIIGLFAAPIIVISIAFIKKKIKSR